MRRRPTVPWLLAAGLWLALGSVAAPETPEQGKLLGQALDAGAAGEWAKAEGFARRAGTPVAGDIVAWARLRAGEGDWPEYVAFLDEHRDWPGLETLRRAGERAMPSGQPPARVLAWFADQPPLTGTGALRLAEGLAADGRAAEAEAEIVRAWRELSMTGPERRAMFGLWRDALGPHHAARLDMLLWRGLTGEAEAMLPLVDADWQRLAQARIAVRRDTEGLQHAINTVPERLKADPGLAYERFLYRVTKGRWQDAEDYIREASRSAEALGRPEMWMERRPGLARQALEDGDVAGAYRIAAQNFGSAGADFAESEWFAGFVALTRMDDPERAAGHFERFRALVFTPISLGRAGYWLGLAHERAGDPVGAAEAFRAAAAHQTSFYGQLAAERLSLAPDPRLAGGVVPDWREADFIGSPVIAAGRLLILAGDGRRASQFLRHAAEGLPAAERAVLAQMAIELGRPEIGIRIAKDAARTGVLLPEQAYPVHAIAGETWKVPTEFAMAIARQESELDRAAVSGAGARGLMQLMPGTAKMMAKAAGLAYDLDKLTDDALYNARLGTEYLADMLARYRGSYLLATAAYNAGPRRVDAWLAANGDPRTPEIDPVIWIESIPYAETRNYVMRVLEGLHVYRARLQGRAAPIQLVADINRTG